MVEKFEDYICGFMQSQAPRLKTYLLAALDSKKEYLCYIEESLGTKLPSIDIRNCELLTEAELFREEVKLTRDGRNRYKVFYLTDLGKEMAVQEREESYSEELLEHTPMA